MFFRLGWPEAWRLAGYATGYTYEELKSYSVIQGWGWAGYFWRHISGDLGILDDNRVVAMNKVEDMCGCAKVRKSSKLNWVSLGDFTTWLHEFGENVGVLFRRLTRNVGLWVYWERIISEHIIQWSELNHIAELEAKVRHCNWRGERISVSSPWVLRVGHPLWCQAWEHIAGPKLGSWNSWFRIGKVVEQMWLIEVSLKLEVLGVT